ncbi:MAG: response regulator [Bdellovibrionaceae bacterium]|nr:response regulator [Pseudobdellovibrionaceae bacterium]
MLKSWRNLSVSKKLYAVFGVMALLILLELMALNFAMNTLSAVRAFVEGEALWSKAQKNAIHSLHQYALTQDPKYYQEFRDNLAVPMGDHQARMELQNPRPDRQRMFDGFVQGGIHPHDIDKVINLLTRFHNVSYISRAVEVWTAGDDLVQELIVAAEELRQAVESTDDPHRLSAALARIGVINVELTKLEIEFSKTLGEGSRWLENLLFLILLAAVLTVESTGLILTFSFSRNLNRSLVDLTEAAQAVGRGDFSRTVPVRAQDELGQLAAALNRMTADLQRNIGQRREAEMASETKSKFLANVSHELRTPLGVIMGYVELLKDPKLNETDRRKYLETVDHTGKTLHRIVNDILDISKVEAGHLDIRITSFDFQELVDEIQRLMILKAESRQTELQFQQTGEIPRTIATDRDRLLQILVNLINNALKFTENGKVTIRYWVAQGSLHFEVQDTGVGIAPEFQDRLFQRFQHAGERMPGQEGAGLGLALSLGIARELGGDVHLKDSRPGFGSTFALYVHLHPTGETVSPPPASGPDHFERLRGRRVLVVDDAPDNQMIIQLFLVKEGVEVTTANDGRDGVAAAMSREVDLILMDMQMPVMNGFDATRELRRRGFDRPIVAFTANAMKGDEARCLDAGCNAIITKPIDPPHLLRTIARLLPPPALRDDQSPN